ncbi:COP9 signalosome (CSN) subunit [Taxawa tesnikishii (nom. ined.)]|nr:COP9 signalosome (CSN) subunit [Dothideales sp. JES 119]
MDGVTNSFIRAFQAENGYALADVFSPIAPKHDSGRLYSFHRSVNAYGAKSDFSYAISDLHFTKQESNAWVDVLVAYWKAVGEIIAAEEAVNLGKNQGRTSAESADWAKVYDAWKDMVNALHKGYQAQIFDAWTIPCLYVAGKYLRVFAIKADESLARRKGNVSFNSGFEDDVVDGEGSREKLEDAARQINRIFSLCITDRAPIAESRKWGLYYIANLLFKTYFKVTFNYYCGVLSFLEENYTQAESHLAAAYAACHSSSSHNIQLILTYLIPTRLLTSHVLPSERLLAPHPRLQRLFGSLSTCVRRGDLAGFDAALQAGEDEFVKRRIYLTLERGGMSRVPVAEFAAALRIGGEKEIEGDEVECLIANLIYKNLLKGYISRTHSMVVLNKKGGTVQLGQLSNRPELVLH